MEQIKSSDIIKVKITNSFSKQDAENAKLNPVTTYLVVREIGDTILSVIDRKTGLVIKGEWNKSNFIKIG